MIVVEDDVLTSKYFLEYMNKGLDLYEKEPRVGTIVAYLPPIPTEGLGDVFFLRRVTRGYSTR